MGNNKTKIQNHDALNFVPFYSHFSYYFSCSFIQCSLARSSPSTGQRFNLSADSNPSTSLVLLMAFLLLKCASHCRVLSWTNMPTRTLFKTLFQIFRKLRLFHSSKMSREKLMKTEQQGRTATLN